MTIIKDHRIGKDDRPELIDDSNIPEEIDKTGNKDKEKIINIKKLKDISKQY